MTDEQQIRCDCSESTALLDLSADHSAMEGQTELLLGLFSF